MAAGLSQLIEALSAFLPLRTVLAMVGVLLVAGSPWWFETVRERQIRGAARRMVRADPAARAELLARVLALAGDRPLRLTTAVEAAIRYDVRDLRDAALATLAATGRAPDAVARLRARIEKPPLAFRDALEAVVRIEGLLEAGLEVGAREALAEAMTAFPGDPDLARLADRLTTR